MTKIEKMFHHSSSILCCNNSVVVLVDNIPARHYVSTVYQYGGSTAQSNEDYQLTLRNNSRCIAHDTSGSALSSNICAPLTLVVCISAVYESVSTPVTQPRPARLL